MATHSSPPYKFIYLWFFLNSSFVGLFPPFQSTRMKFLSLSRHRLTRSNPRSSKRNKFLQLSAPPILESCCIFSILPIIHALVVLWLQHTTTSARAPAKEEKERRITTTTGFKIFFHSFFLFIFCCRPHGDFCFLFFWEKEWGKITKRILGNKEENTHAEMVSQDNVLFCFF